MTILIASSGNGRCSAFRFDATSDSISCRGSYAASLRVISAKAARPSFVNEYGA
jgi:hypothetical protein